MPAECHEFKQKIKSKSIKRRLLGSLCSFRNRKMYTYISMCACPGKCPNKTLVPDEWIQTDKCLYRHSLSGKVVNLQLAPLKVAID